MANQQQQTKPHTSASQLAAYTKCPEAYRRRYLEHERIPPGIALLKGSGVHTGAETNMRQKVDTFRDLPVSDIIDAAVAGFDGRAQEEGVSLDDIESSRGPDVVLGEARDDVAELAAVHANQQAPEYQPVIVEREVTIELPGCSRDLKGVVDMADTQQRIVDFKTTKRRKQEDEAHRSVQLTVYASAYRAVTGEAPSGVLLDVLVQTKTKTSRQVLDSTRTIDDFNALAHRINAVQAAIDAGHFPPASPDAWWCAPKWCGFHSTCPFVQGAARRAQGD